MILARNVMKDSRSTIVTFVYSMMMSQRENRFFIVTNVESVVLEVEKILSIAMCVIVA